MRAALAKSWPARVNRLKVASGKRVDANGIPAIVSSGADGAVLYGPYIPMPRGRFRISGSALSFAQSSKHPTYAAPLRESTLYLATASWQKASLNTRMWLHPGLAAPL